MKYFISILVAIVLGFGAWFGVSYALEGQAKEWANKLFNVEEPVEEPEQPEEPEEPENEAYKIVVTKPEDVTVPTTGTMRSVEVNEKLGGKWYAVDMQRFALQMSAGDLSFTNGYGGETYAYINDYFGIQVFVIENGFLFYLPETFDGSYYVGYDVVNEVEVNETLTVTWNAETLINSVSEGIYVVEESENELVFPYDISAYNLDVTIPEGVEVPQTGTLRKAQVGETFGGKWYAVDYNQIKKEGITSNIIKANDVNIRGFDIDVGIDTFVAINTYSLIESTTVNGVSMFYIPETLDINRFVGYDSYNETFVNGTRRLSWNAETVIDNACSFVYVVEESEDLLAYPYATDEDYCAYKLDVTIPEGVVEPQTGTLRAVEVGEILSGKWYAVDFDRIKAEKLSTQFMTSHGLTFSLYNGCSELDTLVCMNTYSGIECVTVGNVTMFYLPESVSVVRNVGYDRHSSTMINKTRTFSWNSTTDITAVGNYVYVVEEGDGELSFPVEDEITTEPVIVSVAYDADVANKVGVSGEERVVPLYAVYENGTQSLYTGEVTAHAGSVTSGYVDVYDKETGELIQEGVAIDSSLPSEFISFNVSVVDSKIVLVANYVREYSDETYRYVLNGDEIIFNVEYVTPYNTEQVLVLSYICTVAE